jgi:hypothetical protein
VVYFPFVAAAARLNGMSPIQPGKLEGDITNAPETFGYWAGSRFKLPYLETILLRELSVECDIRKVQVVT